MNVAALAAARRRRLHGRLVVMLLSLLGAMAIVFYPWIADNLDWRATGVLDPVVLVGRWRLVDDDYGLSAEERAEIATIEFSIDGPLHPPATHVKSWPVGRGVLATRSGRWPFTVGSINQVVPVVDGSDGRSFVPRAPDGFWVMGSFHPTFRTLDRLSIDLGLGEEAPLSRGSRRLSYDRM